MQMKTLFFLLLPALVWADGGDSKCPAPPKKNICKSCWGMDVTKCCEEKEILCTGPCMAITEHCSLNGKFYKTFKKTCALPNACGNCFTLTTNHNLLMRISYECGEGDYGNADLVYNRQCPDELPKNGYRCPSCFRNDTVGGCVPDGYVLCGGNEFQCVDFRTTIELSDGVVNYLSGQGCITVTGCEMGMLYLPGVKEIERHHLECKTAEKAPAPSG